MYGGKFALQNRLASLVVGRKLPFLHCFTLYSKANSQYNPHVGLYSEGRFNGRFVRYDFGGLILGGARSRYSAPGGAYFRNFMVWKCTNHCDFFSVGLLRTMCILSCVTFV